MKGLTKAEIEAGKRIAEIINRKREQDESNLTKENTEDTEMHLASVINQKRGY